MKTYLVSEEFLKQVLEDALKDDLYEVTEALRTLLAKEQLVCPFCGEKQNVEMIEDET